LPIDSLKDRAGAARRQIVPNRSRQRMTHSEDDSNWQFGPGSLDLDAEEDELLDYSKLLARGSESEPADASPSQRELRRPLARLLARRFG
jgi:hypothetical protein